MSRRRCRQHIPVSTHSSRRRKLVRGRQDVGVLFSQGLTPAPKGQDKVDGSHGEVDDRLLVGEPARACGQQLGLQVGVRSDSPASDRSSSLTSSVKRPTCAASRWYERTAVSLKKLRTLTDLRLRGRFRLQAVEGVGRRRCPGHGRRGREGLRDTLPLDRM